MPTPSLELHCRCSTIHLVLSIVVHGVAMLALWVANLPWAISLLFSLLVLIHGIMYVNKHVQRSAATSVTGLRCSANQWRVKIGTEWQLATPQGQALVSALLICFALRVAGSHQPIDIVLFADSASPQSLHALRLILLLKGFSQPSHS